MNTSTFFCRRNIDRIGAAISSARKQARCNLIEHWPEQMVVVFVENGYLNMCISESAGRVQSSESATDDDHVRRLEVRGHNRCLSGSLASFLNRPQKCQQVGVDLIRVRGGETVRQAGIINFLRPLDEPGRLLR